MMSISSDGSHVHQQIFILHCVSDVVGFQRSWCRCDQFSVRRLQRLRFRLRPNGIWQNVHHDGKQGKRETFLILTNFRSSLQCSLFGKICL